MRIRTRIIAPTERQTALISSDSMPTRCLSRPWKSTAMSSVRTFVGRSFISSRCLPLAMTVLLFVGTPATCTADQLKELAEKAGIKILADGESSSEAENAARTGIPLNAMTQENRQRAQIIIKDRSQFRRLPSLQYAVDETMFRYLLSHPDVAVSTWRVMGISRFEMWQTGENEYEAMAIDGSEGIADILYQDANQMVFVCQGSYHNPLLPRPMQASALIWFRAVYTPNPDGTHIVTQKADVFVRFPSSGVSAIAKVLTPVLHSLMDRNLFEVSLYGSMMSRAVRDEPEWVVQVAQQMDGVLPQRQHELIEVARKPRKLNRTANLNPAAMPAADRSMILSPQLLFLDPPKDVPSAVTAKSPSPAAADSVTASTKKSIPVRTVSSSGPGNLMIISPTGSASNSDLATQTQTVSPPNSRIQRSDDGFILQPVVVPPIGPTATGPVGSESSSAAP